MLDAQTVEHIAHLARIGITEEEKSQYQEDLTRVLGFVDELKAFEDVEVNNEESSLVRYALPRTDTALVHDGKERELILENMPEVAGGALKVRQVL
jgi:aspartyl-tRNA(Asn)/glutamyl-tRNA(Gln) amidotransferase subunit C